MANVKRHKIKAEVLLVVKAVTLGYQIANGNVFDHALNLISSSLSKRAVKPEVEAFYLMVKSEAYRFRQSEAYLNDREKIKELCEKSKMDGLFELFTKLVEKSISKHSVSGGGALSSVDKSRASLGKSIALDPDTGYKTVISQNDDVEVILTWAGISTYQMSRSDKSFLYATSLSKMIEKHFGTQ